MTKFAGKPYAGKPHVRIDEGLGEVNSLPGLLYWLKNCHYARRIKLSVVKHVLWKSSHNFFVSNGLQICFV